MSVVVYDKAKYQIENGIDISTVKKHFEIIFNWLSSKSLLSDEGQEILEIGIDSEVSLNSKMLTDEGNKFISKHYDEILKNHKYGDKNISQFLDKLFV